MKKVLKKGKRGNKKERLLADEEMLNLDDSKSNRVDPNADSGGPSSQ